MNPEHIKYLICPVTKRRLELNAKIIEDDKVRQGYLYEPVSGNQYPIINFIPRFVPLNNYANNFGFEWNKHSRTQYDSNSKKSISETRFKEETKWGNDLTEEIIIEAGCGSGRFTEWAVRTNAMILSFDYSYAVEANYKSNKDKENLFIVQADVYNMPFKDSIADKLFCIGVIQHTPKPELTFKVLSDKIKIDGKIVIDVYKLSFIKTFLSLKYLVRLFTRNINNDKLYKSCKKYIDLTWPLSKINKKLFGKKLGKALNWRLLIPDYSYYNLDDCALKEWAYLDLFDMLSPMYDKPKTLTTVKKWFEKYNYRDIEVYNGYNGIEGRGIKC